MARTHRITKKELLGQAAFNAYSVALYKMGKNTRYEHWNQARRIRHVLSKAFDGAVKGRGK